MRSQERQTNVSRSVILSQEKDDRGKRQGFRTRTKIKTSGVIEDNVP